MLFRWSIIAIFLALSAHLLLKDPEGGAGWSLENIKENIRLGLDLEGGIYMKLEVDENDAVRQYLEEQAGLIKGSLEADKLTVGASFADFASKTITIQGASGQNEEGKDAYTILKDRYDGSWAVDKKGSDLVMTLRDRAMKQVGDEAVNQTVYKIQSRVDQLGVVEPVINRTLGSNRIVVELAGADDSSRLQRIVREPGQLEWRMVVSNTNNYSSEAELRAALGSQVTPDRRIVPYPQANARPGESGLQYVLMESVILTAKDIADVFPSQDDRGLPAVGVKLNRDGGIVMERISGANIGQRLGIVLDGKCISAPAIQSKLGSSFIIMGLSQNEVQDLIVKIKSGSLPARINILEDSSIGPTLGRDAIKSGANAAMMGLVLVMVFIIIYYRGAGLIALFALVLNMILMMGMLAGIGAVLTLPGIAGFILTIGMAVDANVLVFERIREELRLGVMPKNAVEVGYKSAFVTIMDANLTTFLAAFILYLLGEGPVKGFAVMLMIGIVCSIFTAVFCTRTVFLAILQSKPAMRSLSIWPIWQSNKATAS